MASKIELRRNTAALWTSNNPILSSGEPGVETDTHRIKVGDGATPWTALPYAVLDATTYITTYQLFVGPIAPPTPQLGMVWIQTMT